MRMAPLNFSINSTYVSSGSRATTSLNSAYVNGVSGAAIGFRYSSLNTDSLDEFYIYVDSFTGTKANVTMVCTLYNENTAFASRAGTTVRATSTTTTYPSGTSGWVKFEFGTPYTPVQGEVLWFVVTNTAAVPITDFPNVLNNLNVAILAYNWMAPHTTTNGFTSNGTAVARANFMMKQGATYRGNPYTNLNTPTTTTVKRGLIVTPDVDTVIGSYDGLVANNFANITIHESTQLPNDTPVYTYALSGTNKVTDRINNSVALAPYTLRRGKTYYVCVAGTPTTTSPLELIINDYATYTAMFDALVDGSIVCGKVLDSGSNTWTIRKDLTQRIGLMVQTISNPTITSAS